MSGSLVLLHLAGAISLLLWATRMVRTGVERAYGDSLRQGLSRGLNSPFIAAPAGMLLAICFQSSTAVALLVGSFAGAGIVSGSMGLVAALGADLGSALMARLLSFDLSLIAPAALFLGMILFSLPGKPKNPRQLGRLLIGVGLLLLSLRLISEASEPLRDSEVLPIIVGRLSNDPAIAFLLAALLTWLLHSSIAFILLVAAFAAKGLIPPGLGVVLVLGANLGAGLIAVMLSRTMPAAGRAVPLGNLALRAILSLSALAAIGWINLPLDWFGTSAVQQLLHLHIAFNALLLLVGAPFAGLLHKAIENMLLRAAPRAPVTLENMETALLDPGELSVPSRALANVTRAVAGLCDMIEIMLISVMELYVNHDKERAAAIRSLDERVHRRHAVIKLYLARITTRGMSPEEEQRTGELLDACVRLEQVSDLIARNMLSNAAKKHDRKLFFTREGWQELKDLHASVLAGARLAFAVVISRDPQTALELVREKDRLRDLERETSRRHFERLREGTTRSIETSSLHLDMVRDLKQINSLLALLAYPVLEEHGMLLSSRLRQGEPRDI